MWAIESGMKSINACIVSNIPGKRPTLDQLFNSIQICTASLTHSLVPEQDNAKKHLLLIVHRDIGDCVGANKIVKY